jgi:hypothetical protein
MEIKGHVVVFSSGRTRYSHCGIIGIDSKMAVYEGYDGRFWHADDVPIEENDLSAEDLAEMADYMIHLWENFKRERGLKDGAA